MEFKKPKILLEDFNKRDNQYLKGKRKFFLMIGLLAIIACAIFFILFFQYGGAIGFRNNLSKISLCTKSASKNSQPQVVVEEESAAINAVKKLSPSVVSIIITKDLSSYYSLEGSNAFPFYDFFGYGLPFDGFNVAPENDGNGENKRKVGGGTGFIISEDGLILTNKHVVSDEDVEYTVIINDGTEYDAKVLATDLINDIAVVKIEVNGLPVAELGDSDGLQIGQTVIAIGNSLSEYSNTVTKGVVSGIDRRVEAGDGRGRNEVIEEAIQTDAAINPGNSGGPLINLSGQVIGINTAISQAGQLIGFAIPINQAKKDIEDVRKYGKIVRPFLGVRYILINEQIAKANKLEINYGALIIKGEKPADLAVVPGSPADKADLEENDIILEIEGQKIDAEHSLVKGLSKYNPQDEVELKIWHKGEEKKVKVVLEEYEN